MAQLSTDERRYLREAFATSPKEWFRPLEIDRDIFSGVTIDRIVQSLSRRGLMQGQPNCHARLTNLGRKTAAQLGLFDQSGCPTFYKRRRVRIVLALMVVIVLVVIGVFKSGLL